MNRYQNGQIYKIVDVGYNKCYFGSTCEDLKQRMARHKYGYKYYLKTGLKYIKSYDLFDEYGIEHCKIEWVENYPCSSKKELEAREGMHQKENDCINKFIAGRDQKQWREDNKEHLKTKKHDYHIQNRESIIEKSREFGSSKYVCECGMTIRRDSLSRHLRRKMHQKYLNAL